MSDDSQAHFTGRIPYDELRAHEYWCPENIDRNIYGLLVPHGWFDSQEDVFGCGDFCKSIEEFRASGDDLCVVSPDYGRTIQAICFCLCEKGGAKDYLIVPMAPGGS